MTNKGWIVCMLLLCGCGQNETSLQPTPLVLNVRLNIEQANPNYVEKYIAKPVIAAMKKTSHVADTHVIAMQNAMVLTVFFEDGIKFAEGETIVQTVLDQVRSPQKINAVDYTELCGDNLSQGHLMRIAKLKGIHPARAADRLLTISDGMAQGLLPQEKFDAMFSNPCDESSNSKIPVYVLEN